MTFQSIALSLGLAFGLTQAARAESPSSLRPEQLTFAYQRNVEPWSSATCKHAKSDVGLYEWDVFCKHEDVVHRYSVHLVLSYYPRTSRGKGAYEVLYWVTDWTQSRQPASASTTLWVHNDATNGKVEVFELSQGVENDLASLQLALDLTK